MYIINDVITIILKAINVSGDIINFLIYVISLFCSSFIISDMDERGVF